MRGGRSFGYVFKSMVALAASTLNQHQSLCRVAHAYIHVLMFFMAESAAVYTFVGIFKRMRGFAPQPHERQPTYPTTCSYLHHQSLQTFLCLRWLA